MRNLWRTVLAIGILAALAAAVVMLAPSYYRNLKLDQALEEMIAREDVENLSDESVREKVVEAAADLDLPLVPGQVRIDRTRGRPRIEVRYVIRVDMPIYTVDLHFRAGSGAR